MGTMGQEGAPSAGPTPRYRHPRRLPGGGAPRDSAGSGATEEGLTSRGGKAPQASSAFRTPTAGSLQSWEMWVGLAQSED